MLSINVISIILFKIILHSYFSNKYIFSNSALQKKPEEINVKAADMWSYAILLWELATREVPFADLSPMEVGMKVCTYLM